MGQSQKHQATGHQEDLRRAQGNSKERKSTVIYKDAVSEAIQEPSSLGDGPPKPKDEGSESVDKQSLGTELGHVLRETGVNQSIMGNRG